jgi:hypothetical protein
MPKQLVDDLLDLMPDVVIIEPYLSQDRFGNATFDVAFEVPARVIGRTRVAIDTDGNERVSNVQAVLGGNFGATAQDRYTLPERFSVNPQAATDAEKLIARQPRAIAVDKETDENGPHHETVYFSTSPRNRGF